ncbi:M20 family metallopeptidase [Pseudonocardia halophobica]|uniref:Acetylornithine deacetylase n=1 Tax=Pseudonocardia halophobica TaxID=29401 RepID=A0A9W6L533_9PSEU|nr:M20/M25/M40 family metallo-hydrolase [Pseudonocardia halophobica]GLL12230.1 acetylornithine deacetylase [Pseudonocardia halophobica]
MEKSAAVEQALASIDEARVVSLVQDVCRIPSVLGDELAFAQYLVDVMKDSSFTDVRLQDVLPDRPNAIGELDFGTGPRVVLTGHMDTKPESIGWTDTTPYSGELIDGHVYGHGIMDMKAALVCQIVAAEAVRSSGVPVSGRLAFAGVSDHMGDQLGSIRYFDEYSADLCVLGELSDNEIYLGHRGRYYFDITAQGKSAHTCHKPLAVNANMLAAKAILELDASRLTPELEPWVRDLFGEETYMAPGRVYGGLPPGGPSMIPDECVIRLDCRPQPGVSVETVRAELDRCLDAVKAADPRFAARVELADVKSGYVADPHSLVVETMVDAVQQVRGTEPTLQAAGWLGDTASFGDTIPTVIFGPGGEPVYCPNERLSVADIVEATKVYTAFATLALLT